MLISAFFMKFAAYMPFKNYYAVLGVAPNASEDDIKKKFRKLALLYHPDRNAESEFAAIRFREIQEAYETLSDASRRTVYNRSWRDHYPKVEISVTEEISPENILLKCKKLQQDIREMDAFRINHQHIEAGLHKQLADDNIALLLFHNDKTINGEIITTVLSICHSLPLKTLPSLQKKLIQLAQNDAALQGVIEKQLQKLKYQKLWEQYYPLLAFIIAIAACIIIYFMSGKH